MRSSAISLLNNQADEEEIARAISQPVRDMLPLALAGAQWELMAPNPVALNAELSAFVSLVGQDWSADGRSEFIVIAMGKLHRLPGDLVLAAIDQAGNHIFEGRRLVPWVIELVTPKAEARRVEYEQLARLAAIAGIK